MAVSMIPLKLPFWKKLMYALGQFGWSLASFGAANFLNYFYLPPKESGAVIFPRMINQGYIIGFLTLIGLILAFGRVFDAITDPLVAVLSDRSRSRLGRRRFFLAVSVLPFALFSVLVFVPLFGVGEAANVVANGIWVFASVTLLYWFMTMYVTPFFAWLSELGHDSNERLQISTMISITWALGAMIGSQAPMVAGIFQNGGMDAAKAFQTTMWIMSGIGFVFMLLPVVFIDERKYCASVPCDDGFFSSIGKVVKDRNFLIFTLSDLAYWTALYFINNGLMYYVTVLLGLPKEFYSTLFIVLFLASFLFYVPVNLIAKKVGKRRLLIIAFCILALSFVLCSLFGVMPFDAKLQAFLVVLSATIPMAIFGILPNAMVSDMAEAYAIEHGEHKAGVFFGFRTFMSKMGASIGAVLLPSLVKIGADASGEDVVGAIGVRITTFFALGFCLVGVFLLLAYNEKKVIATLRKRNEA